MYTEASKVAQQVESEIYQEKIIQLQVHIQYELEEMSHAKSLISQMPESPESVVATGCILYKEEKYEDARAKFNDALNSTGYQCDIAYNIALCYYKTNQLASSLKHIADIIEKGVREHPELGVGSNSEGVEVKSVGNTQTLKETALIEAFNLKAAIEY